MVKTKKLVKKTFFEVKSPLVSTKNFLYGASAEEFNGKVIKLDLTRVLRGKSLELKMKVNLVNNALEGTPVSLILVGSYIRRMIRKGTDYVEDSFIADSKDGRAVVKTFLITRNKVSRAVRKSLRETARAFLESHVKTRTLNELFSEIMSNKIQKDLSLKLKKIYPLALCEIRWFEALSSGDLKKLKEHAEKLQSQQSEKDSELSSETKEQKEDSESKAQKPAKKAKPSKAKEAKSEEVKEE